MSHQGGRRGGGEEDRHMSHFSFRIIELMHDNRLLPYFRDPYKLLRAAGLEQGQQVLEVGCGPGYFTIPAAEMVGDEGEVYAVGRCAPPCYRPSEGEARGYWGT